MNIEQKKSDDLSITVGVVIEPTDYAEQVKKSLHDFRRNAEIRGFRKGMVPMGLIQKMHGRTALLEEVNKLLSEGVSKYISDNNIKIIGEPLPNEDEELSPPIDWDHDDTFTFVFDMILAPKVEITLTPDDHVSIKQEGEESEAEREFHLLREIRDYLINKCTIELPDALIKRWLHFSNDGKFTMEDIERDYDSFVRDFRWQLIKGHLMEAHHIQITKEEMSAQAIAFAKYRFAMYGLDTVPQDHLEQFAQKMLEDQKEVRHIFEQIEERKVMELIKTQITIDNI